MRINWCQRDEQASQFSWERATRETLNVYESVDRSLGTEYVPAEVDGTIVSTGRR